MKKKDKNSNVLYISFNENRTYFSLGLENGFVVYKISNPPELICQHDLNGGISIIEILNESNIFALVGGGKIPAFDFYNAIIWDEQKKEPVEVFRVDNPIKEMKIHNN